MIRRAIAALQRAWRAYLELLDDPGCPHDSDRCCPDCGGRVPGDW